ncbi:glutaredoxin family protein [Georgenia sp. EYE_87]|uniref:glutaredoxin family protein n=1 Tax=Georgenia sp. EYE_87 TaxID=2853448 RepID=UPI002004D216|nr:glutaredoxin family protein [Georgenia sp. EYE_87]MCK6210318.1 glutaredoxin family protein [Georgenia sp. EYE_87]
MDQDDRGAEVTVVHAPACHLCDDAERALSTLAERFRLAVCTVDVDSAEGRELLAVHRPAMYPLVLVGGSFFSSGRLPRRKLEKLLTSGRARELTAPAAVRE